MIGQCVIDMNDLSAIMLPDRFDFPSFLLKGMQRLLKWDNHVLSESECLYERDNNSHSRRGSSTTNSCWGFSIDMGRYSNRFSNIPRRLISTRSWSLSRRLNVFRYNNFTSCTARKNAAVSANLKVSIASENWQPYLWFNTFACNL